MTAESKLLTMRDAISRHVPSGSMVLLGAQLEQMIPFAAGHELIRQSRRDLTLVGPISDILFDQLIGASCVSRVMAAWVGNVSAGVGYCFRRAVEHSIPRRVEVVDYSNFTMALALHAGALGLPFLPTYATLGSDLLKKNGNLREFASPVSEEKLVAVRALRPDVAILHVQRCDAQGNAHLWGSLGVVVDAARAARKVIVVAEEIVEPTVISSDPNRTLIPGFLVAAVVHQPGGAHPSPVQGYYGRDHAFFAEYHEQTRRLEDFEHWLARWVVQTADRSDYGKQLGPGRVEKLAVKEHAFSAPADFGY
ncbi:MAG TPA: CoA-transferase [Candidatus Acidoferrales bacterium]|jgi:glutaconate CoA-transferase subunit A|nr:CoA-transferase [Candidatus Acidoferrales bacterium]